MTNITFGKDFDIDLLQSNQKMTMKYSKTDFAKEAINHKGFLKKIPDMYRMMKMWIKGDYKTKTFNLLLPILGIIYIISPLDFIPETIPFFGVVDDMAMLAVLIPKLIKEVDKFLLWEIKKANHSDDIIDIEAEIVE